MNTRIIAWTLGLLGVCSLAGCGWERPFRSPCSGCSAAATANGQSVVRGRKTNPAMTVETAGAPIEIGEKESVAASENSLPVLEEKTAAPADNVLPPMPISAKGSEPLAPLASYKEIEHLLPVPKDQDKIVVLSVDDVKPAVRPFVAPEKIKTTEVADADLVNALNRLISKKDNPRDDKTVALRPTQIRYGQADNYQELTGQLQQWRKSWRLRYAAVGAEETYGGSVVLEGVGDTSSLRDGQHLRVRGRLIPAENRQDSPRYVVQSVEVLD